MAFDSIHIPDVVAAAKAPLAVAAVDGGAASYWHQRADGRDPLTMLLDDFIPMVEERLVREWRFHVIQCPQGALDDKKIGRRTPGTGVAGFTCRRSRQCVR